MQRSELPVTRIAMWSGPRNISTAMMRAWGNRPDTFVVDEPFYAFYLKKTAADHPGAEEVIPGECCNYCAMRSVSSSPMRCCHGRQARARLTESGQNIGMPK